MAAQLMRRILVDHARKPATAKRGAGRSRIVELRVMVGLDLEEVAAVLGILRPTVSQDWLAARLFLLSQLSPT